jgi:hypothetical protein
MKIIRLNDARRISFSILFCGVITLPLAIVSAGPDPDSAAIKAEKTEGRSRRILERSEIKREAAQGVAATTPTPSPTPITVRSPLRLKRKPAVVKSEPTPTPKTKEGPKVPKQLNRLQ